MGITRAQYKPARRLEQQNPHSSVSAQTADFPPGCSGNQQKLIWNQPVYIGLISFLLTGSGKHLHLDPLLPPTFFKCLSERTPKPSIELLDILQNCLQAPPPIFTLGHFLARQAEYRVLSLSAETSCHTDCTTALRVLP